MPFPYGKTLRPIDFNSNSAEAIAHGTALAMNSGGALYLMHVVQMNPLTAPVAAQGFDGKDLYDAQVEHDCARLEYHAQSMTAAVRRELIGEVGEPAF